MIRITETMYCDLCDTKESIDVCCDCAQEISETIQRLVNGL